MVRGSNFLWLKGIHCVGCAYTEVWVIILWWIEWKDEGVAKCDPAYVQQLS